MTLDPKYHSETRNKYLNINPVTIEKTTKYLLVFNMNKINQMLHKRFKCIPVRENKFRKIMR
jgi:hypothetical protein